ncbi:PilW family protein [Uliginosibacterium sp. H3]|uniref:PilW family protein n=1 Tax=Uliginosibacterium silvisoli TaxID=3114758 RepID=A0ABU6K637_9RHOO|nr:PilW family protein [Uliginosibacterium sp. H3]
MKTLVQGFSLIELMIALTIGSFITVGAVSVYSTTRQANRIQGMQSRLSEDGRFALSMLRRVVSQAGFRPTSSTDLDTTRLSSLSATSLTMKFIPDGANMIACDGSVATGVVAVVPTISFDTGAKKLSCSTTVGTVTTTTDWIAPVTGGNGTELISGVFEYGSDTSSVTTDSEFQCGSTTRDCVADSYSTTPTTPELVVAVRVCFVLRSEAVDAGVVQSAATKDCAGSNISGSDTDHKLYRTFRSTILVRNR